MSTNISKFDFQEKSYVQSWDKLVEIEDCNQAKMNDF